MEFVPPKRVFQIPPQDAKDRVSAGGYEIPGFLYPGRSKNGGMVSFYQGHPVPRKGFVYAEAVMAVNKAKRITLALFNPIADIKRGLRAFMESFLINYARLVDSVFDDCERIPYLHYEYYSEFSKATWDFTKLFLTGLGITEKTASKVGLILATIFENDDAYKVRVQDILSETTKELLLHNPRKEIKRLIGIFIQREESANIRNTVGGNIVKIGKLVSFLLLVPPIKKTFKKAIQEINFEWFQYDESDLYWALPRIDYQVQGKDFEERKETQISMMTDFIKRNNPGKQVRRVEMENGDVQIVAE